MAITFILNDEAVNDQTTGLQTGDNIDDAFTDTDVAYSTLPASFRTYLETTLGLNSAFPTNVGVATKTNSVTVKRHRRLPARRHYVHRRQWRHPQRR